ncbi:MAG TPA: hypothetical protein VMG31_13130 [Verrucomicrobiae bacterium]|nr:hypothetical protein [Verrucomicrobiae bacterium]
MTRINALRDSAGPRDCVAWGKNIQNTIRSINASPILFAAVLIVCSFAVGCSSEKPKPVNSNHQIPTTQAATPAPMPVVIAEKKPAQKKVVHRKPATVNYNDKTYGVAFEYPRRYAIETGDAATDLMASSAVPMNFVQPGGLALAAVELPETGFANTDFSSAFFNVSVHKGLTADQCNEFAVPQPKASEASAAASTASSVPAAAAPAQAESAPAASTPAAAASASDAQPAVAVTPAANAVPAVASSSATEPQASKLMLGDLELLGTEAVTGEGSHQSDSKYFHVYQNGTCYEFALNVTTDDTDSGMVKHVDRDQVFSRLERILATVKINPVSSDATADDQKAPAPSVASGTPER